MMRAPSRVRGIDRIARSACLPRQAALRAADIKEFAVTRSAAHLIAASVLAALAAPAAFAASHSVVADYTLLKAHSAGMPVPGGLGG